jgi:hypothetical protein
LEKAATSRGARPTPLSVRVRSSSDTGHVCPPSRSAEHVFGACKSVSARGAFPSLGYAKRSRDHHAARWYAKSVSSLLGHSAQSRRCCTNQTTPSRRSVRALTAALVKMSLLFRFDFGKNTAGRRPSKNRQAPARAVCQASPVLVPDQLDELGPRGGERKLSDVLFVTQKLTLTLLLMVYRLSA